MENRSHAFIAGLFALLLGAAAVIAYFWFRGSDEDLREYIVVTRHNIGGLNPQAQVRFRGIRVGKVREIKLDPSDQANILLTIAVKEDTPLTKGTVAKLSYQGVTGIAHILLLDSGKDPEPLPYDKAHPPRIAMIPSLIDELGESATTTLRHSQELMVAVTAVLNEENRKRFAATLANLETATAGMRPALANLDATLTQVRKVLDDRNVDRLSNAMAEVAPLLADTRELVARMQAATDKFDVAVGDASAGGTSALMPRLSELASDFSATSRQLSRVLRLLEESPQGLVFGVPGAAPGPGEPGFRPDGER